MKVLREAHQALSCGRIVITDITLREIKELRAELEKEYQEHTASTVKPAARPEFTATGKFDPSKLQGLLLAV